MHLSCISLSKGRYSAYLYINRVLFAPEGRRWEDFYGFNKGGKWPLSLAAMLAS